MKELMRPKRGEVHLDARLPGPPRLDEDIGVVEAGDKRRVISSTIPSLMARIDQPERGSQPDDQHHRGGGRFKPTHKARCAFDIALVALDVRAQPWTWFACYRLPAILLGVMVRWTVFQILFSRARGGYSI